MVKLKYLVEMKKTLSKESKSVSVDLDIKMEHSLEPRVNKDTLTLVTAAYQDSKLIKKDISDLFRWLQGTSALAVRVIDAHTNLVHKNTVRISIALMLHFIEAIIISHEMRCAYNTGL